MESLEVEIIHYFDDSRRPAPEDRAAPKPTERQGVLPPSALTLGNSLGENGVLKAGGILDQPYVLWTQAVHARWVWDVLTRWSKPDRKGSDFTPAEIELTKKSHEIRTGRKVP